MKDWNEESSCPVRLPLWTSHCGCGLETWFVLIGCFRTTTRAEDKPNPKGKVRYHDTHILREVFQVRVFFAKEDLPSVPGWLSQEEACVVAKPGSIISLVEDARIGQEVGMLCGPKCDFCL